MLKGVVVAEVLLKVAVFVWRRHPGNFATTYSTTVDRSPIRSPSDWWPTSGSETEKESFEGWDAGADAVEKLYWIYATFSRSAALTTGNSHPQVRYRFPSFALPA